MQEPLISHMDDDVDDDDMEEPEGDSDIAMAGNMTFGYMEMVDDELLIETSDCTDLDDFIKHLELGCSTRR
jgi:hypothetical protein